MEVPADANIIVGQSHFIKTVEDLYEAVSTTVPQAKFGLAFNKSSGACLTRAEGNEDELRDAAIRNAGHWVVARFRASHPECVPHQRVEGDPQGAEVCSIFCATANPVEKVVANSAQGPGGLGVIDGSSPMGVEGETGVAWRHGLLPKIGYKC